MLGERIRRSSPGDPSLATPPGSPSGSGLCVVHLVWAPLGPERLSGFLEAYRRHDPGVPHRLLVVLNGFVPGERIEDWKRLLDAVEHEQLLLERPLLDLAAYRLAVDRIPAERYCFMNSYATPLADGWLNALDSALAEPGVGISGATGSWASTRSWTTHVLRLPSAYRGVLPPSREAVPAFMAIEAERQEPAPDLIPAAEPSKLRTRMQTLLEMPRQTLPFERFPAYHVRTNAFMASRRILQSLDRPAIDSKRDAYLLESGRNSLTRQVQRMGLRTLLVDRDGTSYKHEDWHLSRTFWQGDQEGLLIADNQTRIYAEADAERRRLLSRFAWGAKADPVAHGEGAGR